MQTLFKRPISVLVVVYTENDKVLLMRRKHPADYWQSVTGSLEWEETPLQAAQRELLEETGLSEIVNLVDCHIQNQFSILPEWRLRYAPDVLTNTEHVFKLELPTVRKILLNLDEHTEYGWLSAEQAVKQASSATNQDAITQAILRP